MKLSGLTAAVWFIQKALPSPQPPVFYINTSEMWLRRPYKSKYLKVVWDDKIWPTPKRGRERVEYDLHYFILGTAALI